ncbi:MAG: PLDc N-terminal domain-containing protein [Pyrinomonadaceae bacterium]
MIKLRHLALSALSSLCFSALTFAQTRGNSQDPCADACGTGGCAGCTAAPIVMILLVIGVIVLNIALLIWVAKDSKARGMDNSVMWMILVIFTSWVGLIIYILSRPKGDLVQCPNCKNNRLQASAVCPHCGNT